jgi:hypothetical protein
MQELIITLRNMHMSDFIDIVVVALFFYGIFALLRETRSVGADRLHYGHGQFAAALPGGAHAGPAGDDADLQTFLDRGGPDFPDRLPERI